MTEIIRRPIVTADAWFGPDIQADETWIIRFDDRYRYVTMGGIAKWDCLTSKRGSG